MKKNYICFVAFLLVLSCKDKNHGQLFYYKMVRDSDKSVEYKLREYSVMSDTINELQIFFNSEGETYYKDQHYLKKNGDLFLITKFKNTIAINPYLSTSKIDSCNTINRAYGNYTICYEGKVNYLKNKDVYRIEYNDILTDGVRSTIFLDKSFRVIDIIYDLAIFDKEIRINESEVPKKIRNKLKKALSSYSQQ